MTVTDQVVGVYAGDSASVFVAITQADGTPYDPTIGAVIRYRMARTSHAIDVDALITKELGSGISVVPGGVEIALTAADTDQRPGTYYQELKIIDGDDIAPAMTGWVVIRRCLHMGTLPAPLPAS